ncbi:MAG: UTP--glucose-1-phosphate uridylyltransferase, partial [Planctomycetes bacterium]|nr:UTP--glucose-1-phosphate uridylyltransferase [Planctomycetota bacterium]
MTHPLIDIVSSDEPDIRNRSLDAWCRDASADELLTACADLDRFRRDCDNLYQRVRSLLFLSAIYRYHLPRTLPAGAHSRIPLDGFTQLMNRRFEEAIDRFLDVQHEEGISDTIGSALASAYHQLSFQTLADQVRRSVRSTRGNQWMFRIGHPADHPIRVVEAMKQRDARTGLFPVLWQRTPVRMDLSHRGWSDIFFLGMDFPEWAR